jgi:NAD(P)-dependent dehydrogenase (short-subunit alcohol dehydrogenase family)
MSDKIRYVRQLSPESAGEAPGRGRLQGRRILVVGGGQRTFDAATDPVGNGRAMSLLFAREGAHVAVADLNRARPMTPSSALRPKVVRRFRSKPTSRAKKMSAG